MGNLTDREFLRHTLATLAYRAGKGFRGAPTGFERFRAAEGTRTASELLAHLGDLLDWALSIAEGAPAWNNSSPISWDQGVARFFAALQKLDAYLASDATLHAPAEKLFQGAIADSLTHVGQLNMLRRLAGSPIRSENYYKADIATGRVGPEQTPPKFEFD